MQIILSVSFDGETDGTGDSKRTTVRNDVRDLVEKWDGDGYTVATATLDGLDVLPTPDERVHDLLSDLYIDADLSDEARQKVHEALDVLNAKHDAEADAADAAAAQQQPAPDSTAPSTGQGVQQDGAVALPDEPSTVGGADTGVPAASGIS